MLFADGIVWIEETRWELIIGWRCEDKTLESKEFRLSGTKTEYLKCKFSDVTHEAGVEVGLDTEVVPIRERFKYLGSLIHGNADDVTHFIGAAWMKWRL